MSAQSVGVKLVELGFNESDPATWNLYTKLSEDELNAMDGYQAELILGFLRSWSRGDLPTRENILDLPQAVFQELAAVCAEEYNNIPDFSPDGATDPKARTGDSLA